MAYIVIATANTHKVKEYKELINDDSIELSSLADFPDYPEVEENGKTFMENACIKAAAASKYCNSVAFADDSGLEVMALDGRPGIFSARYAPTSEERIAKLLKEMEGKDDRRARFVCAIAIAYNGEVIATFEGEVKGAIATSPSGDGGFGYDPVFVPENYNCSMAELDPAEKNRISHRGKAFAQAMEFVSEQMALLGDALF